MAAPMLRLHWSPKSPYVRKVMVCAHELGLVDRLELVRSVAAMLKPNPALMADNPLSKIPTLVRADGPPLFDSAVICEFLNDEAGDGLLDALILWRNERERDQPLPPLLDAFDLKTRACLALLDQEADALGAAPFAIGHVAVGCALGYLDYRFEALRWRMLAPRLADWFADARERESFRATEPLDG